MLTATRQRRITYVLVGVTIFYLILLFRSRSNEAWSDKLHPLKSTPIRMLNSIFGLNITSKSVFDAPELYRPDCAALVTDNQPVMLKTVEYLVHNKQRLTENEFYINLAQNCDKYLLERNFTETYQKVPLKFPTAYIITAHTSVQQFELLMHSLYNEHNVYCVHVDNSSNPVFRRALEAVVNCLPNVFIATKSESMVENDHSQLRAELHCLRDLVSLPIHWRYVLNLDETSFPLKSNTAMTDQLRQLGDYNMIEGSTEKLNIADDRYVRYKYRHIVMDGKLVQTQTPKGEPPANIPLHHGAPYYVANRNFVQYILSNFYAQEFYNWLNETYAPRELFWASMNNIYNRVQNLQPKAMNSPHYFKLRTKATGAVADDHECSGRFDHNLCVFATPSLPLLHTRTELFVSKFDIRVDYVPLVCLDNIITNPYSYNEKLEDVA